MQLLRFKEGYSERIWGGQKLRAVYGKPAPEDKPIGEAWLISDHPSLESVVADGPLVGETLRNLLEEDAPSILGTRAQLTIHGRFPLLLKIIDANDHLSVQVHPDDETAKRLDEPDVGKTEMWHVLQAEPDSELICGIDPNVTREQLAKAVENGSLEQCMTRFKVEEGTSVFLPSGTVHAIGSGIMLAEIQQNSDLTYRLYDWGRVQADGTPRELHIEKALDAIHFGSSHGGATKPLEYRHEDAACRVLAACRYFAAELIEIRSRFSRQTRHESFHIVLGKTGDLLCINGTVEKPMGPGQAVLVPGGVAQFHVEGKGAFLEYYVPDLQRDIAQVLLESGHSREDIARLGGDPSTSDLQPILDKT